MKRIQTFASRSVQLDVENQGGVGRNAAGAFFSVGQFRWYQEGVGAAFRHQLQAFAPALDDLFQAELDRALGVNKVEIGRIQRDRSDFKTRFDPGHPAADTLGYVKLPNVSRLTETMDLRQAQRSYEANLNVISSTRTMMQRTLDILRA